MNKSVSAAFPVAGMRTRKRPSTVTPVIGDNCIPNCRRWSSSSTISLSGSLQSCASSRMTPL